MNDYKRIVSRTTSELDNIMKVSTSQRVKDYAKKLMGRSVRTSDPMFWPSGMLMLGLTEALSAGDWDNHEDDFIVFSLKGHMKLWADQYKYKIRFVDDALSGYSMIRLSNGADGELYQRGCDRIRDYVKRAAVDDLGSIIYNPGKNNKYIFADGIGQATLFMAADVLTTLRAGENSFDNNTQSDVLYYSESDYISAVGKIYAQFINYYKYGRDSKTGLLYHGYVVTADKKGPGANITCERKGILGWGRAHGWMMMGLSEAAYLEKEIKERIPSGQFGAILELSTWFKELTEVALEYQRPDGAFSWQLNAIDGHVDMSATGMIAYSVARGYVNGLFDNDTELKEKVRKSLLKAKEAMYAHTDNGVVGDVLSSCDDFAVHYQIYGNYPWGQGAVLAALSVIDRI
ncbi:glycoside hydrolase family 88 protein [Butyrivibrio sp. VCB2006]|uniref:glycoside hydrolase family 88 protein n=1 Tax=Butyrivibrio sp. VCB2006 TaxID=1280679 RepID=UPI0003FEDA2B|nr:glycoside hydrolase family 88 protein [Butyrivibrio sp. VCB2006]